MVKVRWAPEGVNKNLFWVEAQTGQPMTLSTYKAKLRKRVEVMIEEANEPIWEWMNSNPENPASTIEELTAMVEMEILLTVKPLPNWPQMPHAKMSQRLKTVPEDFQTWVEGTQQD